MVDGQEILFHLYSCVPWPCVLRPFPVTMAAFHQLLSPLTIF
jgi:hypothetical protein